MTPEQIVKQLDTLRATYDDAIDSRDAKIRSLRTQLEERDARIAKLEKPTERSAASHDEMNGVLGLVVAALEKIGYYPCPAIKLGNEVTQAAWVVWNKQEEYIATLQAQLAEARADGVKLEPREYLIPLDHCPVGLFLFRDTLAVMTEYSTTASGHVRQRDAYIVESGEYFWGGTSDPSARAKLLVKPCGAAIDAALGKAGV